MWYPEDKQAEPNNQQDKEIQDANVKLRPNRSVHTPVLLRFPPPTVSAPAYTQTRQTGDGDPALEP